MSLAQTYMVVGLLLVGIGFLIGHFGSIKIGALVLIVALLIAAVAP